MTTSDTPSRKRCVVLTGAGISADSGLDTFRGAGGLWEGHRVEDVATPEAFARDPQLVLDFYNARRRQLRDVQPNSAHYALAALEEACDVYIVTQNVDNLHERAGSSRVLHLHGELTKLRSQDDEAHVIEWHGDQPPDMKDPAGAPMRPHIVWFGEPVPLIEDAVDLISDADIVMVIGTSLKVYPAAGLVEFAPDDALCVLIDPHPNLGPSVADRELFIVEERAATGVPRVVQALLEQL